jgi:hypothetical protein
MRERKSETGSKTKPDHDLVKQIDRVDRSCDANVTEQLYFVFQFKRTRAGNLESECRVQSVMQRWLTS